MAKRKRDVPVLFWVSAEELELIHQKMQQYGTENLSAYLRHHFYHSTHIRVIPPKCVPHPPANCVDITHFHLIYQGVLQRIFGMLSVKTGSFLTMLRCFCLPRRHFLLLNLLHSTTTSLYTDCNNNLYAGLSSYLLILFSALSAFAVMG